jgi:hypothetical protein
MYLILQNKVLEVDMIGKRQKLRAGMWLAAFLIIWLTSCSPAALQPVSADVTESTQTIQEQMIQDDQESVDSTESIVGSPKVTPQMPEENSDTPSASSTPVIPTPEPAVAEQLSKEPYVQAAILDLAERLQVSSDETSILNVAPVDWSDDSLGCPIPGQAYAQVLTPGYQVTLQAGGQRYEYHTDIGDHVVLCGEAGYPNLPTIPIPTDERIQDGQPWVPVD